MDLWNTLGISPIAGLSAAVAGILAAVGLAALALRRTSRAERKTGLDLGL